MSTDAAPKKRGRPPQQFEPRTCEVCGDSFMPRDRSQKNKKTCSRKCLGVAISKSRTGKPAHNDQRVKIQCGHCGADLFRSPSVAAKNAGAYCDHSCRSKAHAHTLLPHAGNMKGRKRDDARYGEENPAWKGGVTYRRGKGNYIGPRYVRCPEKWLMMARKDGYIMEHRLVMAEWVGRPLTRTEVVNHKNHNPRDNRRENLELYPTNGDHKRGEVNRFVDGVCNRWEPPTNT